MLFSILFGLSDHRRGLTLGFKKLGLLPLQGFGGFGTSGGAQAAKEGGGKRALPPWREGQGGCEGRRLGHARGTRNKEMKGEGFLRGRRGLLGADVGILPGFVRQTSSKTAT